MRAGRTGAGAGASAPAPRIVVTGGIHYDYLMRFPRLPRPNDRISAIERSLAPGGMGGNVAAIFGRLGGDVRFAGLFTKDEDGRALRADLALDGVDCRWSGERDGASWRGFILVGGAGERAIIGGWPPLESLERSPGRSVERAIATTPAGRGDLFELLRGVFSRPGLFEGVDAVACPSNFAPALIDLLPPDLPLLIDIETGHLDHLDAVQIDRLLARAAIVYGNEENLRQLAARLGRTEVGALAGNATGLVVMTRGADGCSVYQGHDELLSPGFAVDTVDSTGAGDSFAAAFTFGHLSGWPLDVTAAFANAVGALSTRQLGSRAGVSGLEDALVLMDCDDDSRVNPLFSK